jgi:hypothetical protein
VCAECPACGGLKGKKGATSTSQQPLADANAYSRCHMVNNSRTLNPVKGDRASHCYLSLLVLLSVASCLPINQPWRVLNGYVVQSWRLCGGVCAA